MFFKGGVAPYWTVKYREHSALEFFCQGFGAVLLAQALASWMSNGKRNKAVAAMNFYGNLLVQFLAYKALSNDEAAKGIWKLQNLLGLVAIYLSGKKYMVA